LEVSTGDAHSTLKINRILIVDIEAIEPVMGTRFQLRYFKAQSYFTAKKSIKIEVFESRYLAEIMDCYE
jgi:hypothetical protein